MKRTLPDGEGRQIVVGLSGGVDSAVSAWLLKEAGWQVTGLFMKNWEDDDDSEYCSSRQDWLDAASVADVIGIDLEAVNFAADYRERVFSLFLQAYEAGFTPNPDILCNAEIKFKAFLDHALALGAERIATGHYAGNRIGPDGLVQLLRGADANKDQSYFLHRLNQYQLSRAVFPLAGITKPEVREIAARIGLPNATKKDSTGICFIGERPFRRARWSMTGACRWASTSGSRSIPWVSARASASVVGATTPTARPGSWLARIWPATRSSWCAGTTTPCCSPSGWLHAMSTGSARLPSRAAPMA